MCWGSVGDWIPPEGCHYYELVHGWVRVFAPILGCLVRTREWGREDFFIPPFDWFSWLSEALWSLLEWIIWVVLLGVHFPCLGMDMDIGHHHGWTDESRNQDFVVCFLSTSMAIPDHMKFLPLGRGRHEHFFFFLPFGYCTLYPLKQTTIICTYFSQWIIE